MLFNQIFLSFVIDDKTIKVFIKYFEFKIMILKRSIFQARLCNDQQLIFCKIIFVGKIIGSIHAKNLECYDLLWIMSGWWNLVSQMISFKNIIVFCEHWNWKIECWILNDYLGDFHLGYNFFLLNWIIFFDYFKPNIV